MISFPAVIVIRPPCPVCEAERTSPQSLSNVSWNILLTHEGHHHSSSILLAQSIQVSCVCGLSRCVIDWVSVLVQVLLILLLHQWNIRLVVTHVTQQISISTSRPPLQGRKRGTMFNFHKERIFRVAKEVQVSYRTHLLHGRKGGTNTTMKVHATDPTPKRASTPSRRDVVTPDQTRTGLNKNPGSYRIIWTKLDYLDYCWLFFVKFSSH